MVLIIDDDIAVRASLSLLLKQSGFTAVCAADPDEAVKIISDEAPELIILDLNFSISTTGEEGLKLLKKIKSVIPSVPVILITAWGSIPLAVEGMKLGASDFINKPWSNDHLVRSIKTSLQLYEQKAQNNAAGISRTELDKTYDFEGIIGENKEFLKMLETAGKVSSTDASILITGESGTGKELIAEAVHQNSSRSRNHFIKVNLGGISTSLFESEMFGHKKGAFTDAREDRMGRFEAADKGTIFLDEIGELDLNSQVKLLRVLQDRSFEVLGSSRSKTVDVRVISATNRDLKKMVEKSEFREDLYYRINLITIHIPPLRERREDIPKLIDHFVNNMKTIYRRDELRVSSTAIKWLSELPWNGNIRELKNHVERTILVSSKSVLEIEDFSAKMQPSPGRSNLSLPPIGSMTLEEMEESMIKKALEFHEGNLSRAAKSLGLSRGALYRRMEKFGITG